MEKIRSFWSDTLAIRKEAGNFRRQQGSWTDIDFCSNDYLGLASNTSFQTRLLEVGQRSPSSLTGPSGSRIIRGHTKTVAEVEQYIAETHQTEMALLVASGYVANLALLSCILQRGDTILVDEHIHRSAHDACKLSTATKWKFDHNNVAHLEFLLGMAKGRVVVVIESLYSMGGDLAPLEEIVALSARFGAGVVVDEAHAIGVFGLGLVHQKNLQQEVLATVVTYGKAFGLCGAAILGSKLLGDYLLNYSSPLIYTTGMSAQHASSIQQAYIFLKEEQDIPRQLEQVLTHYTNQGINSHSDKQSPIQSVRFASNNKLLGATEAIRRDGLDVYPIFSPTVKVGTERLRICLHVFNTNAQIDLLAKHLRQWQQ